MSYSVGDVAAFAGVTVRTLHHYDDIKLLSPSGRTAAGYRQYEEDDLRRLQQLLFYRQLGFGLDQIRTLLDDPDSDPIDHLRRQHALLVERIDQLERMAGAVKKTMEARTMGISLNPDEMFEVFDDDPIQYTEEVQQRWGDTEAFKQSQGRTSSYTKEDWLRITAEAAEVEQRLAAALTAGLPADGSEAMDAAEAARMHIQRWFYDLPHAAHRGLADMYITDPRFTAHYDDQVVGLAQYTHDAIHANADRAAG